MSALTEGVKAIYDRKRRRLLRYDGGMSFEAIGVVTPPIRYETLERNALDTLRNLTQAQLLDKTGMVPDPGDGRRFVSAHYRRGGNVHALIAQYNNVATDASSQLAPPPPLLSQRAPPPPPPLPPSPPSPPPSGDAVRAGLRYVLRALQRRDDD